MGQVVVRCNNASLASVKRSFSAIQAEHDIINIRIFMLTFKISLNFVNAFTGRQVVN